MNDDELERRLAGAFDAQARTSIPDERLVPQLELDRPRPRRIGRIAAPIAAAAAVAAVAIGISLSQSSPGHQPAAGPPPSPTQAATVASTVPPATLVEDKFALASGTQVGVGMPVVAYFSAKITDARALQAATRVTVNKKPITAAWYFEPAANTSGYVLEGHLRPETYWPAHAAIQVTVQAAGLSAGAGYQLANNLDLAFRTGAETIATVDDHTHLMTVTTDSKPLGSFPVSLGAASSPTLSGTKVIMAKGGSLCLTGPGYSECNIKYTQRLTYSGEYLLAASWNTKQIEQGIDTSNGCTNLITPDAAKLFKYLEVGDVVEYPNAGGPRMTAEDGYGDWNVSWAAWQTGGIVPTH